MYCTVLKYLQTKYGSVVPTTMTKKDAVTMGIPYPMPPSWLKKYGATELIQDQVWKMIHDVEIAARAKTDAHRIEITSGQLARLAAEWPDAIHGDEFFSGALTGNEAVASRKAQKKAANKAARARTRADRRACFGSREPAAIPEKLRPSVCVTVKIEQTVTPKKWVYDGFYETREWRELRYKALVKYGPTCQCCGATRGNGVVIHVDHIKPRSKFPKLQLELSNMQILCADCNLGKSNKDATDWRGI